MSHRVRRPWLLAACRFFLYAGAAAGVAVLGGVAVVLLGVLFVATTLVVLLVGDVNPLGVVAVGGLGLLLLASLALLLVSATRRVDRAVREAARIPTPLERLHGSYVAGAIDEGELERRLERLLRAEASPNGTASAGTATARRSRWAGRARERSVEEASTEEARSTLVPLAGRR